MNRLGTLTRRNREISRQHHASWLSKTITAFLQPLPRVAAINPIPVVTFIALLASLTYIVLLEDTLNGSNATLATGYAETTWPSLARGSRQLRTTPTSNWTWYYDDLEPSDPIDHVALLTLVFPGTTPGNTVSIEDIQSKVGSVTLLSSKSHPRPVDVQDTTLSFCIPYFEAPRHLDSLQEISINDDTNTKEDNRRLEGEKWVMRAAREHSQGMDRNRSRIGIAQWIRNSYSELLDLLRTTQTLDIVFMALGYASMNVTFASLIISMRRLGSRISLAASVLISSFFAFLFGLLVTTKGFHVPISMRLLSEGLPFLVVLIGFEKNITLSQSILSHAIKHKQSRGPSNIARYAVETAIQETGFSIVRDYTIEILLLVAGSLSGIQGGLQEFCFLAVWILFFDCVLLFLFYTPVLCIKLEIDRIKRHADIRDALEDDGISHRVAENVARVSSSGTASMFGSQVGNFQNIPSLKGFMAGCIALLVLVNVGYLAYIEGATFLLTGFPMWSRYLSSAVITNPSVDPFKVAPHGLESLLLSARISGQGLAVNVLRPIRYELTEALGSNTNNQAGVVSSGFAFHAAGRSVADSLLSSLEDPVLHKWIMGALSLSVAFNIYLYNAARWGIKNDIDATDGGRVSQQNDTLASDITSGSTSMSQCHNIGSTRTLEHIVEPDGLVQPASIHTAAFPEEPKLSRRTDQEMIDMHQAKRTHELGDEEVVVLSLRGMIPGYALEKALNFDYGRAVKVRRNIISRAKVAANLTYLLEDSNLPYKDYDWSQVFGACCENVIGYMPIPVGVAGPLIIDGRSYFIPMATTEGVLVASTSRGAKAINAGGGAVTILTSDGMTRGPCLGFKSVERAGQAKSWIESEEGRTTIEGAFNSTSRFARLQGIDSALAGTCLYVRFKASTADAMGMNMISKGVEKALSVMKEAAFEDMEIVTLTGNYCTDKKASAMNWIQGRGKSVVAEALIPSDVVKNVLKTDIDALVDVFVNKNMIGSAMAGSIGGFNAQAANIVAAIFIATGQDPAQVVESANCITIMKRAGEFLHITVSMPSIEVGTLGGGTILDPQGAMLDLLGVRGPHGTQPGANARRLARIIAAATMAGELSLCSALAAGHLVTAHMQHNRSVAPTRSNTPAPATRPTASLSSNKTK
ncbi:3-hydroxy-3-methylglutaryl-coenzyme A reductase [Colletotrichum truncatum]|uniref:3-hydroxy-3-methylglutaryl-coenzyme A reductase n=1 Tax=Colletotrichum truncatum TaxID=5467 RepID=A0ACC3ZBP4_COLTU|nr:3-hydroxy-3-methylglutaryl-coenzyme A reductase [Colletotrichum truncatum]KAF6787751.1 3-hydroxy-3-methylglutaryl-coenzyme A reductase [Colletotrichum truncatum]